MQFGDVSAIAIERFDRVHAGPLSLPRRIHQEDACQALGIDLEPSQGRAKYESGRELSLRAIAKLLAAWGDEDQLLLLLDQLVFTIIVGDADAHGKNIALLHTRPGHIVLAPLYDTVPTALWPNLRTRAAMSVGAAVDISQIDGADIIREATSWGVPSSVASERVKETTHRLVAAAQTVELVDDPITARVALLVELNAGRVITTS